jgi:CheY-like chemotaxis protein
MSPDVAHGAAIRRCVLVVDDDADSGDSLALLLQMLGHDAAVVRSGEAALLALERSAAHPYDLVFLDVSMPGMDGYEVARVARLRLGQLTPRMVALTGWADQKSRERSAAAGFDLHLVKPVEVTALEQVVQAAPPT